LSYGSSTKCKIPSASLGYKFIGDAGKQAWLLAGRV